MPEGEHSDPSLQVTRIGLRVVKEVPGAVLGAALLTTALPGGADKYTASRDEGDNVVTAITHGAFGMAESILSPLSAGAEGRGGKISKGLRRFADVATGLGVVGVAAAMREPSMLDVLPHTLGGVQDALRALSDAAPSVIKNAPLEQVAAGAIAARNFTLNALDVGKDVIGEAVRRRNQPIGRPSNEYRQKQELRERRARSSR